MARQDQHAVSLIIDGVNLGIFDTRSGGAAGSEEVKHRPGGMGAQRAHGGPPTIENLTLTREYIDEIEEPRRLWLEGRRGKGRAVVVDQHLDVDGNAFGRPEVFTGILLSVKTPEHDSNSGDLGMLEIEVSTDGTKG